jgi:hypothetical protein
MRPTEARLYLSVAETIAGKLSFELQALMLKQNSFEPIGSHECIFV